ncbi:MAG: hypothetical protein KDD85_13830 [Parvularculaceae bacterium]|nr:hypothetical protein [Parvularculaceae bacterium]
MKFDTIAKRAHRFRRGAHVVMPGAERPANPGAAAPIALAVAIVFIMLPIAGCASAVYDSLGRRGVDSTEILLKRLAQFETDARAGEAAMREAGAALEAVESLDGEALARRIARIRGAADNAALAAQQFRLSSGSLAAATSRYFSDRDDELDLYRDENRRTVQLGARLRAARSAHLSLSRSNDEAQALSPPALRLIDAEAAALRAAPTSAALAASRAGARAQAVKAAQDAAHALARASDNAAEFSAVLNE